MRLVSIIIAAIAFAGCHRHAMPQISSEVRATDSVTVMYFYHDTVITPAPAVAAIHDTLPCPGLSYSSVVYANHQHLTVTAKNGVLDVNCSTDSLQLVIRVLSQRITELQRIKSDSTIVQIKEVPVSVIKYPKFLWWSIGLNVLLLAVVYFSYATGIKGIFSFSGSILSKIKF